MARTKTEILQEIQQVQAQIQRVTEQRSQISACRSHPSPLAYYGSPYRRNYHQRLIEVECKVRDTKVALQHRLQQLENELQQIGRVVN